MITTQVGQEKVTIGNVPLFFISAFKNLAERECKFFEGKKKRPIGGVGVRLGIGIPGPSNEQIIRS